MGSSPSKWVHDQNRHGVRYRGAMPWYAGQVPRRWHACRPQTVELQRANGLVVGICHCACGAFTDNVGRWVGRNSRKRTSDPAHCA